MLIALTLAATLIWVGILLAPWQPWRTRERLEPDPDGSAVTDLSDITAVVPARDEAPLIGRTISGLLQQGPGLRIVVVDDQSTDGTADVARAAGGEQCQVIAGAPLPTGWVGKLWALEQGRSNVRTSLTLLVDADIELRPGLVSALLRRQRSDNRSLVSLMAVLEMRSGWEKLLVPAFVYFFKLLYPFRLANASGRSVAAAAGGCVLVDSGMLTRIGGFAALRDALIDDCALARRVKDAGGRTWIGLTHGVVSRRRMDSLRDIWRMVQRSAYAQLRYSLILLAACAAVLAVAFWIPPVATLAADTRLRALGLIAFAAMVITYVPTLWYYNRSPLWALALPLTGTLYLLMTVSSAIRYWRGSGSVWKGRAYKRDTRPLDAVP
jgi:hopene-associated glycosyltransferase HpnB